MRDKAADRWIPFWVDKWLFGSTRLELEPAERSVWIDLLALASKDEGHIRANIGVPYKDEQLAAFLCVPIELFKTTIEKCLDPKIDKIERFQDETLRIKSWGKYELSERHKRRMMSGNADIMSEKPANQGEFADTKNRIEKNKNRQDLNIDQKFNEFWAAYPREGRLAKKESLRKFTAIYKRGDLDKLIRGFHGYLDYLKAQRDNRGFQQTPMYAKTFLNGRWEEYIGFKHEPRL